MTCFELFFKFLIEYIFLRRCASFQCFPCTVHSAHMVIPWGKQICYWWRVKHYEILGQGRDITLHVLWPWLLLFLILCREIYQGDSCYQSGWNITSMHDFNKTPCVYCITEFWLALTLWRYISHQTHFVYFLCSAKDL